MRACDQSSPSPSRLPTDSLVGVFVIAELAIGGAVGAEVSNQISTLAGFEHRTSRLAVQHADHVTTRYPLTL